jgi:hypothetical protein
MELDEVRLTKYWSVKVTTPKPGEVRVYLLLQGEIGASIFLQKDELHDAAEGFRAVAEVLEEGLGTVDDVEVAGALEGLEEARALSGRFVPEELGGQCVSGEVKEIEPLPRHLVEEDKS